MDKLKPKQYRNLFILGLILIIIFKMFDPSWFSFVLQAIYPVLIGAALAYILAPLVKMLQKVCQNSQTKFIKQHHLVISVMAVFLVMVALLALLLYWLVPVIMNYLIELINNINIYYLDFQLSVKSTFENPEIVDVILMVCDKIVGAIVSLSASDYIQVLALASKTGSTILTILMGLIFCPYILIEANKLLSIFDRLMLCFISQESLDMIHQYTYKSHRIFGDFIYGKFIDSVIIGLIALVGFYFMDLPFYPLLAFVIFITNIIPYFGPFIGGVPVTLIILIINGFWSGLATGIFIFILQQFDGIILGPHILSDTVGVSPFWIITSITVFGSLFGFMGMLLGVPMICVIRMFFHDYLEYKNNKTSDKISDN